LLRDRPPASHARERSARAPGADQARALRFVRRVHRLRTLGLGLGFLCVASVLRLQDAPFGWWVLLLANGFAWPHMAWLLTARSADPLRTESRNLMADSVLGGIWIAVMQFNLLPSVLLATMLSLDKLSVGGPWLLLRTSALLLAACALTSAALGFPVDIVTPMSVIGACIPLLVAYPLAVSGVAYTLASKLARQNRRLDELGRTDGLTGLANRRQCFALAEIELARHYRTGRPASLLILDIDHFKDINDRYGHPMGDEVLCAVAQTLRGCCRETDTPTRYGGDEFLLMLPDTSLRGAEEAARRIRRKLETMTFEKAPDLRCTVSLGAAEAGRDIANVDLWVQQADAALYRAKAAGRNRFMAATPLAPSERAAPGSSSGN
jgi:diguanylate cyclase